MPDVELEDDPMTFEQVVDQLYYWQDDRRPIADRERAFDALLGWVAGRATVDPDAASTLRLIRDRAERS